MPRLLALGDGALTLEFGDRIDADGNTDDPLIIDAVAAKLRALVDALTLRAATPGA